MSCIIFTGPGSNNVHLPKLDAKGSYVSSCFQLQFFVIFVTETPKKVCSFVLIAYSKENLSDTSPL